MPEPVTGTDPIADDASPAVLPRRRRRTAPWIAGAVGLLLVAFFAVLATREPGQERAWDTPLAGKEAPDLRGQTIDGGTFDITSQRGRWVVVNFFATWCPPCVKEHPELLAFHNRHKVTGDVAVVSVLFNDSQEAAAEFFAENGGDWPVVVDARASIAASYGFFQPPESYLIDPNGVVYGKWIGGITDAELEAFVQEAQAGYAAAVAASEGAG